MVERNIRRRRLPIEDAAIEFAFNRAIAVRDQARQDDGRVDRHVRKHVYALNYYLRRLITEQPYVGKIKTGKIISIDTETKTCVAAIEGEQALIDNIKYYPPNRRPKLNKEYAVHFEIKLRTRTMDETSEPEPVERWIKQFDSQWLYRKGFGNPLLRYAWPPPDDPDGWNVELVKDEGLPTNSRIFGGSTPDDVNKTTEVVLEEFLPTHRVYYHFDQMGSGDLVRSYSPEPIETLLLLAIANDGTNTTSARLMEDEYVFDLGYIYYTEDVILNIVECCLVDWIGQTQCLRRDNYEPTYRLASFGVTEPVKGYNRHRLLRGEYGNVNQVETELVNALEFLQFINPGGIDRYDFFTASGCEIGPGNIIGWLNPHTEIIDYDHPDGLGTEFLIRQGHQYAIQFIGQAWNYNGNATHAWVYGIYNVVTTFDALDRARESITFVGYTVKAAGHIDHSYVVTNEAASPVGIALSQDENGDGNKLIVWWEIFSEVDFRFHLYKTEHNSTLIDVEAERLFVLHRAGNDVVVLKRHEGVLKQFYSINGGEDWTIVPACNHELAGYSDGFGGSSGDYAFIDEFR